MVSPPRLEVRVATWGVAKFTPPAPADLIVFPLQRLLALPEPEAGTKANRRSVGLLARLAVMTVRMVKRAL